VDVNLTEHSTVITFSDYHDGAAPFLLINHTEEEIIEYGQRCVRQFFYTVYVCKQLCHLLFHVL